MEDSRLQIMKMAELLKRDGVDSGLVDGVVDEVYGVKRKYDRVESCDVRDCEGDVGMLCGPLLEWQSVILGDFRDQGNYRILWLCRGDADKLLFDWFIRYFIQYYRAFKLSSTFPPLSPFPKTYNDEDVCVAVCTRRRMKMFPFRLLEEFKNGMFWQAGIGWMSNVVERRKTRTKAAVFGYCLPEWDRWSRHRYYVFTIYQGRLLRVLHPKLINGVSKEWISVNCV